MHMRAKINLEAKCEKADLAAKRSADDNATHHWPDKARANHLNPGLATHSGLIHGRHASQRMELVATIPVIQAVKNIAQKSNEPASETLAHVS